MQWGENWGLSLGFHLDHTDPSLTIHLPGIIVAVGRLKQPGFRKVHRDLDVMKRQATEVICSDIKKAYCAVSADLEAVQGELLATQINLDIQAAEVEALRAERDAALARIEELTGTP